MALTILGASGTVTSSVASGVETTVTLLTTPATADKMHIITWEASGEADAAASTSGIIYPGVANQYTVGTSGVVPGGGSGKIIAGPNTAIKVPVRNDDSGASHAVNIAWTRTEIGGL